MPPGLVDAASDDEDVDDDEGAAVVVLGLVDLSLVVGAGLFARLGLPLVLSKAGLDTEGLRLGLLWVGLLLVLLLPAMV